MHLLVPSPLRIVTSCLCGGQVNVLTRRPEDWADKISISTEGSSWEAKGTFVGPLNKVKMSLICMRPREVTTADAGNASCLKR